jgi:N-carbamoyl-L-amino-acid hydrolase
MPTELCSIDPANLASMLEASAQIGRTPRGGLSRLTLTKEDKAVRDLLTQWAHEKGYGLEIDKLGNMFVRREGTDRSLSPVLIGSHLDTQAKGGRYDGVLGVLSGFEILCTLDRAGITTKRAIEVVNWTNEEGARFQPPMLCSLAFSGQQSIQWVYDRRDKDGIRFEDALLAVGYRGESAVGGRPIDCYFELHIEQAPCLDKLGISVGVVTGGFPMRGMRVSVRGETSHVGPTPMNLRRNALVGAAYLATAVDEIGWRFALEDGKTTVARLDISPNLPGIISDEAELYIDFRHPSKEGLAEMEQHVEAATTDSARRSGTLIKVAERWGFGGLEFDRSLIELVRETAKQLEVSSMDLRSEAGHDAYHLSRVCPATMIFTPCRSGISHNEREDIDLGLTVPAINVLLHAVLTRASRPIEEPK